MPRFNVRDIDGITEKWRCFSTVVDDWITGWMDKEEYLLWRQHEYGEKNIPLEEANQMSLSMAEEVIKCRKERE